MDSFYIVTNKDKDPEFQTTRFVKEYLEKRGKKCTIRENPAEGGGSYKYTDASAWEYYQRSKDHYLMHPETRALLEKLLRMVRDLGRERTFAYMKFLLGCETDY